MKNVLILCTGNSCRSQMAEGYLRQFAGEDVRVLSAGIETHGINPLAIRVMAEEGIDLSGHSSNHIDEYRELQFDYLITVCDHAREHCPWFPSAALRFHQSFPDPAQASGTEEELLAEFRAVRDQIRGYAEAFAQKHLA